jgi:hypothetical protein
VFVEDTDDVEKSILSSNFKPIWGVLNALKSHDETLSLELDQLRTNLGRQASGGGSVVSLPDKIIFDLPTTIDKSFSDALKTIIIDKTTNSWNFWYGLLLNYYEDNGDATVPVRHKTKDGLGLGSWVNKVRREKVELTKERKEKLESLGFIWDVLGLQWDEGFKHLKEFFNENSHTLITRHQESNDGFKIGNWAKAQRTNRNGNKLTSEKIEKLDSLDFVWNVEDARWNRGLEHLQEFVDENGDAEIPNNYKSKDGFSLNTWIIRQRMLRTQNRLSSGKIEELDSLNCIWDMPKYQWDKGFEYLKEFFNENGHTMVSRNGCEPSLNQWVRTQRKNKLENKLTSERIRKLESLDFVWDVYESNWNEGFQHLKEFLDENGNAMIGRTYKSNDGFRLGTWVGHQRWAKKEGKLDKKRISMLESLDFIWDALEFQWDEGFEYLKRFINENGNAKVTNKYKTDEGYPLGSWVGTQRQGKKNNSLTQEKIKKLESLNFIWETKKGRS